MTIKVLPSALEDLADGFEFYEKKEAGLGDYFLKNLYSDIDSLKRTAGVQIGRHGTLEDLELLERLCDYWTGDRSLSYHGGNAMTQIRERIHYDLNGPIVKAGRFVKPIE